MLRRTLIYHQGVHDAKGQAVKEGYAYLAQVLVGIVGLKKAAAARVLGVHRLSIFNWLEEGQQPK